VGAANASSAAIEDNRITEPKFYHFLPLFYEVVFYKARRFASQRRVEYSGLLSRADPQREDATRLTTTQQPHNDTFTVTYRSRVGYAELQIKITKTYLTYLIGGEGTFRN
jgi:hypothetical protein